MGLNHLARHCIYIHNMQARDESIYYCDITDKMCQLEQAGVTECEDAEYEE